MQQQSLQPYTAPTPTPLTDQPEPWAAMPPTQTPYSRPRPGALLHTLAVLKKRKWTIVAVTVIVASIALLASFRMVPQYDAVSRIGIFRDSPDTLGLKDSDSSAGSEDWDYTVAVDTQTAILKSDVLALQVIRALHLDRNPDFAPVPAAKPDNAGVTNVEPDYTREASLIETLKGNLKVTPVPHTRIVEIRYSSPKPQLAAEIANAIANGYIEHNFKTKFEATLRTSDWLANQLKDVQTKVEVSQAKLVQFQKEHNILGGDEKQNIITSKLDDLNKELTAAEADRISKEARYRLAGTNSADAITPGQNLLLDNLRTREADLKSQYAQAIVEFGPSYPKVVQLKSQLETVQGSIQAEIRQMGDRLRTEYLTATQREKTLRGALEAQKQQANTLNRDAIEYNLLKRDVDTNRQLYEGLLQKLKEAGITAGLRSNNVRIVDSARVPLAPARPNIPRNFITGLFLGLVLGLVAAFVQELADYTVQSATDVEELGLPVLAFIPRNTETGQLSVRRKLLASSNKTPAATPSSIVVLTRSRSNAAESFRAMRTSILLSAVGSAPKVILITSPLAQEGKTTVSTNTAVLLAQQGARVLLIDADMRRPTMHKYFDLKIQVGLSTVLAGGADINQAIVPASKVKGLHLLTAGPTPPYPSELLGSAAMINLLQQLRTTYDHIVIDTPPVLSVTDAVLLSVQADSVIVVARAGRTAKSALQRTYTLLASVSTRVIGVVLNHADRRADSYYYDYGAYGVYNSYYSDEATR